MKLKTNALEVIQGIMISLAVIAIIVVVVMMIIQGQIDNQVTTNTGINCSQNSTGGTEGVLYTGCGASYDALVSLRTQVTSAITWVGIAVTVAIGFSLIAMFYKRK